MVKDHSDSEKGNPLPPHRLLFPINSKGSFICTIPQTGVYVYVYMCVYVCVYVYIYMIFHFFSDLLSRADAISEDAERLPPLL